MNQRRASRYTQWTKYEDDTLLLAAQKYGNIEFGIIKTLLPNKSQIYCRYRLQYLLYRVYGGLNPSDMDICRYYDYCENIHQTAVHFKVDDGHVLQVLSGAENHQQYDYYAISTEVRYRLLNVSSRYARTHTLNNQKLRKKVDAAEGGGLSEYAPQYRKYLNITQEYRELLTKLVGDRITRIMQQVVESYEGSTKDA